MSTEKDQNKALNKTDVSGSVVVEDKIFYDGNGGWETQSFRDGMKKLHDKFQKIFFYKLMNGGFEISYKRKEQKQDNLKWAWIKIGNTRKMCWVDNVTNKVYKADGYGKTNIEIKNFTFERWCTGFDL